MRLFYFILLLIFCNATIYAQISEAKKKQIESMYDKVHWWMLSEEKYKCIEVEKGNKVGVLDDNGNVIFPCKYDEIVKLDNYFVLELDGKCGIFDLKGEMLLDFKYSKVLWWQLEKSSGCEVELDGKIGVIDKTGKALVPCKYDDISYNPFSKNSNIVYVKLGEKRGVYDIKKDREVIPCKYSFISPIYNDVCAFVCYGGIYVADKKEFLENGKWGYVDMSNERIVIPCEYDFLTIAGEKLFRFNIGGKVVKPSKRPIGGLWGVIDSNNKVLFNPEYTEIERFKDGVAKVVKNGVASIIVNPYSGTKLRLANGASTCQVDNDIPTIERTNDETFAFVFANENYKNYSGADYAINDGKVFAKYCCQTLGIPESNVKYYEDATFGNMQSALKKMQDVADVYDGDAKIIFYFSGLGFTDNNQRYILPSDASLSSVASTGVSVENVLSVLNGLNTKYTFALFDAPFNGTDKSGKMLEAARGVKIKSKAPISSGRTIAVFGSSDDKNNYCYEKNVHGLLTYNILQQIRQSKGQSGIKTLIENAIKDVEKSSLKEFKDVQSPQIVISESMKENWQNIKF